MAGEKVDLYSSSYANYASEAYRQVRIETYGEDFGQTSWVTTEESEEIPKLLNLKPGSFVLEIGCGSGGMRYTWWKRRAVTWWGSTSMNPGFATQTSLRPPRV